MNQSRGSVSEPIALLVLGNKIEQDMNDKNNQACWRGDKTKNQVLSQDYLVGGMGFRWGTFLPTPPRLFLSCGKSGLISDLGGGLGGRRSLIRNSRLHDNTAKCTNPSMFKSGVFLQ